MTFRTLIQRSLRFHWRSHLGVGLGAAIGSAALIGALVVGDSVRESLRTQARERLGEIRFALSSGDRFFTDTLAEKLPGDLKDHWRGDETSRAYVVGGAAMALGLPGTAVRSDGGARANRVMVYGIPQRPESERPNHYSDLFSYGDWHKAPFLARGEVWLNAALARQLQAELGSEVLLRLAKPGALAGDVSLAPRADATVVLRLRLTRIVTPQQLGNFSLRPGALPPLNAFVNLAELQEVTHRPGQANLLVTGPVIETDDATAGKSRQWLEQQMNRMTTPGLRTKWRELLAEFMGRGWRELPALEARQDLQDELGRRVGLPDYEVTWQKLTPAGWELRSPRVFLDAPLVRAALTNAPNAQPILTYLATLLRAGAKATPYSMVTAAGAPWTPSDLRDDEIVITQWLAEDLHVQPGDQIALSYFLPESGAQLEEATNTFRVHSIVPPELPWADRILMPDFPGIEKAERTSDWDAGFPLTYEIRKQDDEYWQQYRGTPKAFITLAAGQKLWGNRFGNLTAIRFPIPANTTNSLEDYRAGLERALLAELKPEALGLRFEPVREQALRAANEAQDFGGLFLGFSFFLILAALLLMALLFRFGLEQRAPEIGTLLALGFTPKQVRQLVMGEGIMLAFLGGMGGAAGGIYFARALLHGLNTAWNEAVGGISLSFYVTGTTLVTGLLASGLVATLTIWLGVRKFVRRPARELLVGEVGTTEAGGRSPKSLILAAVALLMSLSLVGWAGATGQTQNAGIFFGAGALALLAGLGFINAWLRQLADDAPAEAGPKTSAPGAKSGAPITTLALAVRGSTRRRQRSLTTVAMLACGSFLITSIGVFRLDANRDATQKTSGTGGFALWGEATVPVMQDLNTETGRDFFALDTNALPGVQFIPFRVREGDEASCLNLNAAPKPRLLGVRPEQLAGRFTFAGRIDGPPRNLNWDLLRSPPAPWNTSAGVPLVPAIGDANSVQWAMRKKLGDTIDFVDAQGQPFKVWIVATVANSILQGQLLIDEAEFVRRFPGESGYRTFLIETPSNSVATVTATLTRALQDVGLELTPTAVRLNQFNAVQNTYLGTFQILGGLGLLLGSVGLGVVVLRNVLERRSELAVLLAIGFRTALVQRLVLWENTALLLLGLALGLGAAAVAVLPAVLAPGGQLPYLSLALTLAAVLANGWLWTWVATRWAVRGDLLTALRND